MAKSNSKKLLAFIGLGLFLLVFPVATVMLSKSGLDKYRAIKSDMALYKDSLFLPVLSLPELNRPQGQVLAEAIRGRAALLQIHGPSLEASEAGAGHMRDLQKLLHKEHQGNYLLISLFAAEDSALIPAFLERHRPDTSHWRIYLAEAEQLADLRPKLRLTQGQEVLLLAPDTRLCEVYDLKESQNKTRSFQHLGIVLPAQERKSVEYRNDKKLYE